MWYDRVDFALILASAFRKQNLKLPSACAFWCHHITELDCAIFFSHKEDYVKCTAACFVLLAA